ncbi:MAG: RNA-binding transcriptional accessory protein, partial [Clostridia bacterium]|nr:RNA-binding transcriptional accessory protein [Clostridia bacterium]
MAETKVYDKAKHVRILAKELNARPQHVANVIDLIDEGNTIPFIARYRKEMHGAMDDERLRTLADRLQYLRGLDERKDAVLKSIEEQGKLTDDLRQAIDAAETLAELEDLYRPYKQKKRTRATIAKEKGLEPLALRLLLQGKDAPEALAAPFVDPEKGVETIEDALTGASDIIAEIQSDDADNRKILKEYIASHATVCARAATEEDSVYRTY